MAATIGPDEVAAAGVRISGRVRRVAISPVTEVAEVAAFGVSAVGAELLLVHEYLQHTGSFKARGAMNLAQAHRAAASMPA
ncbi:MAG: hypothetical protein ACR2N4_17380, partial [Jatrophihabitans sp.]